MPTNDVDGNQYKHCLAWRFSAGNNYACVEMCSEAQRAACNDQQRDDGKRCTQCGKVKLENPIKASFHVDWDNGGSCTWHDVEFCSEDCAEKWGVGKKMERTK